MYVCVCACAVSVGEVLPSNLFPVLLDCFPNWFVQSGASSFIK